jgi:rhomboid family GlyGly-CTERM serine protease
LTDRSGTWLAMSALLAAGAAGAWFAPSAALDWQPPLAAAEPWRWWSAAFVHWSEWHLIANLAALAVLAWLGSVVRAPLLLTLAWLASWPMLHLSLLLQPQLAHYGGLSGMLHAGVAVLAVFIARHGAPRQRTIGALLLAGLILKILLEQPWAEPLARSGGSDIAVAPMAHATGAAWGALACALALGTARLRRGHA